MDKTLPTTMLNYDDATRWIFDRINYERVCPQKSSAHFCLERIESFLALVGSPQKRIPAIHIAGTKGKGSTAAILDSILRNCGIRTGLFTSPHIHQFEERMRVDGEMPSPDELSALVNDLRASLATGPPDLVNSDITYFEVATLLAWMYFDRRDVEYVVLETGMGGRLDCTNVCHPIVTIITTIGLDHTHILGDTLAQIAAEKAGIIKSGIPVVTWAVQPEAFPVIADRAHDLGCPLLCGDRDILLNGSYSAGEDGARFTVSSRLCRHENLTSPLLGEHQARNSALAVVAADLLAETEPRVTPAGIRNGVSAVSWPLRFEIIQRSPTVVLDAAHNPQSAAALATTLVERFPSDRRRVLVFGSSRDKDARRMLEQLCPQFDCVLLTEFQQNVRAARCDQLRDWAVEFELRNGVPGNNSNIQAIPTPEAAFRAAEKMAGAEGIVCATGSIFLAAEIQQLLQKESV